MVTGFRLRQNWSSSENEQLQAITFHATRNLQLIWFALAAAASIALLAVSNHLVQNVASVPLLWILPLVLYLLSFILCFESARWYKPKIFRPLLFIMTAWALVDLTFALGTPWLVQVILYCCLLFVLCMACHGELAARRPPASHLTQFYLAMAAGGVMGGLFVGLIAPTIFSLYLELPLILVFTFLFILVIHLNEGQPQPTIRPRFAVIAYLLFAATITITPYLKQLKESELIITNERNFYGTLTVRDQVWPNGMRLRKLVHGTIIHGLQNLDDPSLTPLAYYSPATGIGQVLSLPGDEKRHVGMIGLGVGTIASYGRTGDRYRFYEINEAVTALAHRYFDYLNNSKALIQIIHGDGRLSLDQEDRQQFDVLGIDAFSGDSIPVHLLTHEAFALYAKHLKDDGILAVHTSNKFLNLKPVILGSAAAHGFEVTEILNPTSLDEAITGAQWFILTRDKVTAPMLASLHHVVAPAATSRSIQWSDNFSNIFQLLK